MPVTPRPMPVGVDRKGNPLWSGESNRLFREAHGVRINDLATSMNIAAPNVSMLYEFVRRDLPIRYDRAEKYFTKIEHLAKLREERSVAARAALVARMPSRTKR
jgi:hypothetical protein